jgi:predicted metalloprotease with PDZ domain
MFGVEYSIRPNDPLGHYIEVDTIVWQPAARQMMQMPSWIPGSYMTRDFSRHIVSMHAYEINDKSHLISPLLIEARNSDTWEIHTTKKPILVRIKVYAFDTSVRTAYLDVERCFYNHTSLCLQVLGQTQKPCLVHIEQSKSMGGMEVSTSLPKKNTNKKGFGSYWADNYDALIDHPVSIGKFQKIQWKSFGIPHQMMIIGATEKIDAARLASDLKAITSAHIAFFEPTAHAAPFADYLFHVNVSGNGYGGLEHRSSTALLCKRTDLPYQSRALQKKSYEDFLGLCSHEYFHAWNVKNIQPEVFQSYQLQNRNHTSLLWLFEGFTSYYDDLQLLRSKTITQTTYLERLSRTINQVMQTSGRHKQSVAQSSFDAWTKYYLMDENTPNAVVSYYAKGSLIALGLDLTIRQFFDNAKSLDHVMLMLWKTHGNLKEIGKGITETGFKKIVLDALGLEFSSTWNAFEKRYILGTEDLPLSSLLETQGFSLTEQTPATMELALKRLGVRTSNHEQQIMITHVLEGGAAARGGVHAGDLCISMNRERVTASNFKSLLEHFSNQEIVLHIFRQDLMYSLLIPKDQRVLPNFEITTHSLSQDAK